MGIFFALVLLALSLYGWYQIGSFWYKNHVTVEEIKKEGDTNESDN